MDQIRILFFIVLSLVLVSTVYSLQCTVTQQPNPTCTVDTAVCANVKECFDLIMGQQDTSSTIEIEAGIYPQCIGEFAYTLTTTLYIQPQNPTDPVQFYCNETFLTATGGENMIELLISNISLISIPSSTNNDGFVMTANVPGSYIYLDNVQITNKAVAVNTNGVTVLLTDTTFTNNTFGIVSYGPLEQPPYIQIKNAAFIDTQINAIQVTDSSVNAQTSVFSNGKGTSIVSLSPSAPLTIFNCTFDSNTAVDVAAINTFADLTLSISTFSNNYGGLYGAIVLNQSTSNSFVSNYFVNNTGNYTGDLYFVPESNIPRFLAINQFINSTCLQCAGDPNRIQAFGPGITYELIGSVNVESNNITQCSGLPIVYDPVNVPYYTCLGVSGCVHGYASVNRTKVIGCSCFQDYTGPACGESSATSTTSGTGTTTDFTTTTGTTDVTTTTGTTSDTTGTTTSGTSTTSANSTTTSTTSGNITTTTTTDGTTGTTGNVTTTTGTGTTGNLTTTTTTTTTSTISTTGTGNVTTTTGTTTDVTTAALTTITTTTTTTTSSSTSGKTKDDNKGKIVGTALGVSLSVLLVVVAGGYLLWKKYKKPYQGYSHI